MPKVSKRKHRLHEKRFAAPPKGIIVDTVSAKFRKEEFESEEREREAARESD